MPAARQRLIAGRAAGVGAACAAGQLPHLVASEAGHRNRVHAGRAGRHRLSIPHSPLRRLCGGRHGSASVGAPVDGATRRRSPARRWRPGGGVLCHCRGGGVVARLAGAQVPAGQASAAGQRAGRARAVVAGMLRTLGRVPAGVPARRWDGARPAAGGRRGGALGAARHAVRAVPARTGQRDPHLAGAAGAGVARRRAAVAAAPQPPPAHLLARRAVARAAAAPAGVPSTGPHGGAPPVAAHLLPTPCAAAGLAAGAGPVDPGAAGGGAGPGVAPLLARVLAAGQGLSAGGAAGGHLLPAPGTGAPRRLAAWAGLSARQGAGGAGAGMAHRRAGVRPAAQGLAARLAARQRASFPALHVLEDLCSAAAWQDARRGARRAGARMAGLRAGMPTPPLPPADSAAGKGGAVATPLLRGCPAVAAGEEHARARRTRAWVAEQGTGVPTAGERTATGPAATVRQEPGVGRGLCHLAAEAGVVPGDGRGCILMAALGTGPRGRGLAGVTLDLTQAVDCLGVCRVQLLPRPGLCAAKVGHHVAPPTTVPHRFC